MVKKQQNRALRCSIRGTDRNLKKSLKPRGFLLMYFIKLTSRARKKACHLLDRTQAQTLTCMPVNF